MKPIVSKPPINHSPQSSRPDARDFTDARAYLLALFDWRKSRDQSFSYQAWSKELGFQSRIFLRLMVIGKRAITERSIPLFIEGLGLKNGESDYFRAMVRFQQATTLTDKDHYSKEMAKARRMKRGGHAVQDQFRFLASKLTPRLQTLLTLPSIERTPENLATLLGVKTSDVSECLHTLESLGMAEVKSYESGRQEWQAKDSTFEVNDNLGNEAIQLFHKKSLEEAISAIALPPETRSFQSLLLTLNPEEYQNLHAKIREVFEEALRKQSSPVPDANPASKRLYQININLIPVSEPLLHSKRSLNVPVGSDLSRSTPDVTERVSVRESL